VQSRSDPQRANFDASTTAPNPLPRRSGGYPRVSTLCNLAQDRFDATPYALHRIIHMECIIGFGSEA